MIPTDLFVFKFGGPSPWIDEPDYLHDSIELSFKTPERIYEKCAPLYEKGLSLREIARQTGDAKTSIKTALNKAGVVLRKAAKNQELPKQIPDAMRSGVTPYGYCYLEGKLVMDTREHAIVLQIMNWWHAGKSVTAIAELLNQQKIRTRMDKKWSHSVVSAIIKRQIKKGSEK